MWRMYFSRNPYIFEIFNDNYYEFCEEINILLNNYQNNNITFILIINIFFYKIWSLVSFLEIFGVVVFFSKKKNDYE